MSTRMLTFVDVDQQMPQKRGAKARARDFDEIYDEFLTEEAAKQASRCSQCGVPFCQIHCPLGQQYPGLAETDRGRPPRRSL